MTDATITIEIDSAALAALLEGAADRLGRSDDLMALVAARMHRAVDLNFRAEGRPEKWAPIRRQGKILTDSGALKSSITERSDATTATVGTNKIYGRWQHFGTRPYVIRPRRRKALAWQGAAHPVKKVNHPGIKARPFMVLPPEDEAALVEIVESYLSSLVNEG